MTEPVCPTCKANGVGPPYAIVCPTCDGSGLPPAEITPANNPNPNCRKCWDKGYASVISTTSWGVDFPGDKPGQRTVEEKKYCICELGCSMNPEPPAESSTATGKPEKACIRCGWVKSEHPAQDHNFVKQHPFTTAITADTTGEPMTYDSNTELLRLIEGTQPPPPLQGVGQEVEQIDDILMGYDKVGYDDTGVAPLTRGQTVKALEALLAESYRKGQREASELLLKSLKLTADSVDHRTLVNNIAYRLAELDQPEDKTHAREYRNSTN